MKRWSVPLECSVRSPTVIQQSPSRGFLGSTNLLILVTCSEDNDPHETVLYFQSNIPLSVDINIKIVTHPGAISTTCTYVWLLLFAYAN